MKFFNIDCHCSVIADISNIFNNLGHDVDDWSVSGHSFVMGKQKKEIILKDGTKIEGCAWITREKAKIFYDTFKDEFNKYDGFICCYPVEFCILFELWEKPIIIVNCIRYEHPFTHEKKLWNELNAVIESLNNKKLLYWICNNKGDLKYTEYFTKIKGTWIPSLCEYTNAKYDRKKNKYLGTLRTYTKKISSNLIDSMKNIKKPYKISFN